MHCVLWREEKHLQLPSWMEKNGQVFLTFKCDYMVLFDFINFYHHNVNRTDKKGQIAKSML